MNFKRVLRLRLQAKLVMAILGVILLLQPQPTRGINGYFWLDRFKKYENNPILRPQGTGFEQKAVFNPGVILDNGIFYMFYRAQDADGRSTIGLAQSEDGINFTRHPEPVISPQYNYELPGGCEDPRIAKIGNTYYITYTGYSHKGTPSCLAMSKDLMHWEKLGPITPNKSAAILNRKIDGKYWVYFGDSNIWVAHSTDMIHWEVVDEPVMRPRKGYFDEGLVEPGPPPIITEEGILLIYNGSIPKEKAMELGKKEGREKVREYTSGWALFSIEDPTRLIARCEKPFLTPTEDFEKNGQVDDVVFSEGLVKKNERWFLYYGCADTRIGVAITEPVYPVLKPQGDSFERDRVYNPTLIVEDTTIWMIYRAEGEKTGVGALGLAWSTDGVDFTRYEANPIIKAEYDFEMGGCEDPRIVKFADTHYLFYDGWDKKTPGNICLATSKDLIHWKKHGEILQPKYKWEDYQIKAPAPVPEKINGKYWLYYQGERKTWYTRMGLAYSKDLFHWEEALPEPVMRPREDYWDSQGTEPGVAVVMDKGIFLIYNGWDETTLNKAGWALFSKEDPTKLVARCDSPIVSYPNNHEFATGLIKFKNKWYLYYGYADTWIERKFIDIDQLLSGVK